MIIKKLKILSVSSYFSGILAFKGPNHDEFKNIKFEFN
jgi:hypothetical protein